jgi:hypothetical protein
MDQTLVPGNTKACLKKKKCRFSFARTWEAVGA